MTAQYTGAQILSEVQEYTAVHKSTVKYRVTLYSTGAQAYPATLENTDTLFSKIPKKPLGAGPQATLFTNQQTILHSFLTFTLSWNRRQFKISTR